MYFHVLQTQKQQNQTKLINIHYTPVHYIPIINRQPILDYMASSSFDRQNRDDAPSPKRIKLEIDAIATLEDEWINTVIAATSSIRKRIIDVIGEDALEIPEFHKIRDELKPYIDACRGVDVGSNVLPKVTWGIARLLQECVFPQHGAVVIAAMSAYANEWNPVLLGQLIDRPLGNDLTVIDNIDGGWCFTPGFVGLFTNKHDMMKVSHIERLIYMLATAPSVPKVQCAHIMDRFNCRVKRHCVFKYSLEHKPSLVGVLMTMVSGCCQTALSCIDTETDYKRVYDDASVNDIMKIVRWNQDISQILEGLPKEAFSRHLLLWNTQFERDSLTKLPCYNDFTIALDRIATKCEDYKEAWCKKHDVYFTIKGEDGCVSGDVVGMYEAFLKYSDPFLNKVYAPYS